MSALSALETLFEVERGEEISLPAELERLYGRLRLPRRQGSAYVIANFVNSIDGVVALDTAGRSGGGEIGGFNRQDKMVMGLLRAIADAAIVGAGTLHAAGNHLWTAARIFPELADLYAALRAGMGKARPPLNVVVSANGTLDLTLPVFQSGEVEALILTTRVGRARLAQASLPDWVQVEALAEAGPLGARAMLDAVHRHRPGEIVLVEGGPLLLGRLLAEKCLDELFLTLAPQIAGREGTADRPGLISGHLFAPGDPCWGSLVGVRRSKSHLFLRYAFPVGADQPPD